MIEPVYYFAQGKIDWRMINVINLLEDLIGIWQSIFNESEGELLTYANFSGFIKVF